MFRIKQMTIEQVVILLFCILPVVDSLNGILVTQGLLSIGAVYKVMILGILFLLALRKGGMFSPAAIITLCILGYIAAVIAVNVWLFSGTILNTDYPIKLAFNVLMLALLLYLIKKGAVTGRSIHTILNVNTWLMIAVILVPYVLGLGNTIYSGGVGYKGFFYSNNELSAALIILFYFSLYRLARKIGIIESLQLLGIMACVLLLNTKSSMAACLVGVVVFVVEYLCRKKARFKWVLLAAVLLGLFLMRDFIIAQVQGFLSRQAYLYELYGGSLLDTIVSGRTFKLEKAWTEMVEGPGLAFRILFGSGFCLETLVEMDFIDIFLHLGCVGVAGLTGFLVYAFIASVKHFKKDGTLIRPVGYLMVVGFAALAGHVFFVATSGCYFVLLCCLNMSYSPQINRIGGPSDEAR